MLRIEPQDAFPEKSTRHIYSMEDNYCMQCLSYEMCSSMLSLIKSSSYILSRIVHTANTENASSGRQAQKCGRGRLQESARLLKSCNCKVNNNLYCKTHCVSLEQLKTLSSGRRVLVRYDLLMQVHLVEINSNYNNNNNYKKVLK